MGPLARQAPISPPCICTSLNPDYRRQRSATTALLEDLVFSFQLSRVRPDPNITGQRMSHGKISTQRQTRATRINVNKRGNLETLDQDQDPPSKEVGSIAAQNNALNTIRAASTPNHPSLERAASDEQNVDWNTKMKEGNEKREKKKKEEGGKLRTLPKRQTLHPHSTGNSHRSKENEKSHYSHRNPHPSAQPLMPDWAKRFS